MQTHDWIIAFSAFISEVLGTLSGFGSSTFFVPLATFFESLKLVLAITSILHCFGNISKIYLFKSEINLKRFIRYALPSIVMTGIGATMAIYFSSSWLEKALGLFLVIFAIFKFFSKEMTKTFSTKTSFSLLGISGFLTGLIGTGGAIRGIVLSNMAISKDTFVALSAFIDFGGDLLRAILYISNGFMDWSQWFYIPLMMIAAFLGSVVGKRILSRINQKQFEKIVSFFILISGLAMLFGK
ncbi:sulfite exporter TauE/SafE family protein [Bacteriovorax stolpii]|uniref:Probable membrane transporter protein n=1 Tax=Bacteriovorax stolpii TaxID=960 RepID=A0A2K9NM30_BACTC|nr:sulfite exporter TauE/SafE family protein [Bacteriovorax stolpii]AUN96567.1 hypothetical protein C0V70_00290 [Bacteriovorax stolpii]QDK43501.1 sulfite exporter TauE/SafE family protein [Bacteriovorax stolpii]TDP53912.1 hypothetical protein C8D79_1191 [Bacteriovorax stolpii]